MTITSVVPYILLMLWGGEVYQSGMMVVQQEFSSFATCEVARKVLAEAHSNGGDGKGNGMRLRVQGCFKK